MVSSRFRSVLPSPTVSLNNKFAEIKERGENAISFGVGEPDATTPEDVIDFAMRGEMCLPSYMIFSYISSVATYIFLSEAISVIPLLPL